MDQIQTKSPTFCGKFGRKTSASEPDVASNERGGQYLKPRVDVYAARIALCSLRLDSPRWRMMQTANQRRYDLANSLSTFPDEAVQIVTHFTA